MQELVAKLRYFPDDALIPIREKDLKNLGQKYGVRLALEAVVGQYRVLPGQVMVEATWELPIEEATQSVVTVEADAEEPFRRCVRELIDTYRGPVPMWGLWGSTQRAADIVAELLDQDDGW